MKRKGGRVVSAGTTSVSAAAPTSSSPAIEALPSIDVFARFQNHRDDFDANWIMAQEDPAAENAVTFSPAVAQKLKRHQSRLDALRAGGNGGAQKSSTPAATRKADTSAGASTADARSSTTSSPASHSSATTKATKHVKMMRVDSSLEAAAEANNAYRGEPKSTRRPPAMTITDSESDDDEEYRPENVAVAPVKAPEVTPAESMPVFSPPPMPEAAHDEKARSHSDAKDTEEVLTSEEGLQGDYLSFTSASTGAKSLNASALQATVVLTANSSASPLAHTGDNNQRGQRGHTNSAPFQNAGRAEAGSAASKAGTSPVTVPLWSVRRMERFGGYCTSNQLVALHQEVMDFIDFLRPTQAEVSIRRYLEKEVSRLAKKLWPESEVIVYGSLYTHLLLPLSDVDMTLINVPVPQDEALTALAKEISQADLCETAYPQVILKTKVPLVKFEHKGSLVPVDISVDATDGKTNSDIVIRLLQLYPQAQPLATVIKYFLQQRGMDEPYHGGLGSYATTLLVISFLQNHPIYTTDRNARTSAGLGKLLVDFFRYYGLYWNFFRCGVSVEDGGRYFYRDQAFSPNSSSPTGRGPQGPMQVVIEDPANSANNAASSLRMMHVIASLFAHAYRSLTATLQDAAEYDLSELSPDATNITLRPTLLSRTMHVDAETVYRRQCIDNTYARLCEEEPEYMREVEAYRRDEDEPLLSGKRSRRVVSSELKGSGAGVGALAVGTTRAERVTLASLRAAAAKGSPAEADKGQSRRKRSRHSDNSESSSESSSYSSYSDTSSRSNASSVRKGTAAPTERRRRLEGQSKWKR